MTQARPALSLVIPAYDEAPRLEETFAAIDAWLQDLPCEPVEVLLADDGSNDDTLALMQRYAASRPQVSALALPHRGKGPTVRSGMLAARGERVLFSDADFSAPLDQLPRLLAALDAGADVAIGSREGHGSRREGEPRLRHVMGRGFNLLVQALVVPGIDDTQCGFKLFRRDAAQAVFGRLQRYGEDAPEARGPSVTAFDVEVLFLARKLGYRIAEVPVRWVYAEGSKVRPVHDAIRMANDVLSVRLNELCGRYEV